MKKVLVLSAWPYAYNVPHLGNLIGSLLSGDVFSRYYKLRGYDTLYVSGSDMHGASAEFAAIKEKTTPKKITMATHKKIKKILKDFEIEFDNYTTTESATHKKFVKEIYLQMEKNGYITTATERRAHCNNCKLFLADNFIEGTCPHCGATNAKGNQCDGCGRILEAEELKNPVCKVCNGKDITFKETKHWYLSLDKLEQELLKYVQSHPEWNNNVKNFTENFIKSGLKQRAVTRDLKWGIKAPFKGAKGKVIYVWAEAALGYVSATIEETERWKEFWLSDDVKHVYVMGKDNIPFHTMIFPGQLLASRKGYHLPDQISATEYLNWEANEKFSKSRNVGIFSDEAMEIMPSTQWRFYLLSERPETKDSNFSWDQLDKQVNQVLIGNMGNLVNRTLTFMKKYYDMVVPKTELNQEDKDLLELSEQVADEVEKEIEGNASIRNYIDAIAGLANKANAYFQQREPWKNEGQRANTVYTCLQIVKDLAIYLEPVVPTFSADLWKILNLKDKISWANLEKEIGFDHKLKSPKILVEKVDIKVLKEKYKAIKEGGKK